jgi:hypothetical protein
MTKHDPARSSARTRTAPPTPTTSSNGGKDDRNHSGNKSDRISSSLAKLQRFHCASRELSSLKSVGLLTFTEAAIEITDRTGHDIELLGLLGSRGGKRLVPVPRQVLKFLARCTRPALAKTIVAYLIRGLSLERGGNIRSAGTVKVSWICKLCQISERAVRSARAELIRSDFGVRFQADLPCFCAVSYW